MSGLRFLRRSALAGLLPAFEHACDMAHKVLTVMREHVGRHASSTRHRLSA
jgi:hypothetical protein